MTRKEGSPLTGLVLAAGAGKRMRSNTVKVLHPLWGRPMLEWVFQALSGLDLDGLLLVLGRQAAAVREAMSAHSFREVIQAEPLGTGHAVMAARPHLENRPGDLLILNGDLPLLREETLLRFRKAHQTSGASLSLLTTRLDNPTGYGRIIRAGESLLRVVEEPDADTQEKQIQEINCGVYLVAMADLLEGLDHLHTGNAQGEYYLTDVVKFLAGQGRQVRTVLHENSSEVLGVNSRAELGEATRILGRRKLAQLMADGVTILDPARTDIDPRVRIGPDTVIHAGVRIEGQTVIGPACTLLPGTRIQEARIGAQVTIKDCCVIERSEIRDGATVGPFAHLRPGTYLAEGVKVGNFVETKKAFLGAGSKASHLSYLGDTEMGKGVNIGAGTITCNYDGFKKNRTVFEDGVFIGSDTQLVAPVRVGSGAYVGAGTTVTRDVPAGALATSRAPQKNKEGWVARHKKRLEEEAAQAAAGGTPGSDKPSGTE